MESVHEELSNLQLSEPEAILTPEPEPEEEEEPEPEPEPEQQPEPEPEPEPEEHQADNNNPLLRKIKTGKQQTGMKNMSFGVGAAVTPSNKMEFDQEDRRGDFGVVKINRPHGKMMSPNNDDAMSTSSKATAGGDGFTGQGYYDLKFYHNKLW